MFHKILVALDGSNLGETLFKEAVDLAQTTQARLLLLHILNPLDRDYPDAAVYPTIDVSYPALYNEIVKRWQEEVALYEQRRLDMLKAFASEAEVVGVATEFTLNVGDPGRTICTIAHTWGADLIMLGRRGHSGLSELFLGSVSNYVLHHAPCSVLTVQSLPQKQTPPEPREVEAVA